MVRDLLGPPFSVDGLVKSLLVYEAMFRLLTE